MPGEGSRQYQSQPPAGPGLAAPADWDADAGVCGNAHVCGRVCAHGTLVISLPSVTAPSGLWQVPVAQQPPAGLLPQIPGEGGHGDQVDQPEEDHVGLQVLWEYLQTRHKIKMSPGGPTRGGT